MLISLASNRYLFELLAHLITGLTALNGRDPALKAIITQINEIIGSQKVTSVSNLINLITRAQDIVKSYGIKASETPTENPIENLPLIFHEIHNELDILSTKEQLSIKASLKNRIDALRSKAYFFYRISK